MFPGVRKYTFKSSSAAAAFVCASYAWRRSSSSASCCARFSLCWRMTAACSSRGGGVYVFSDKTVCAAAAALRNSFLRREIKPAGDMPYSGDTISFVLISAEVFTFSGYNAASTESASARLKSAAFSSVFSPVSRCLVVRPVLYA